MVWLAIRLTGLTRSMSTYELLQAWTSASQVSQGWRDLCLVSLPHACSWSLNNYSNINSLYVYSRPMIYSYWLDMDWSDVLVFLKMLSSMRCPVLGALSPRGSTSWRRLAPQAWATSLFTATMDTCPHYLIYAATVFRICDSYRPWSWASLWPVTRWESWAQLLRASSWFGHLALQADTFAFLEIKQLPKAMVNGVPRLSKHTSVFRMIMA